MGYLAPSAISLGPIQTIIKAKGGPNWANYHSLRECVNGARNVVSLAVMMVNEESRLKSRLNGQSLRRILHKLRASVRYFLRTPIQTLIAAMRGPDLLNSHTLRECL